MTQAATLQAVQEAGLNPTAKIINFPKGGGRRTTKGRTFPPDPILADDVHQLMQAIQPRGPQEIHQLSADRLRALIAVLYRSGLRINEALALVESDIHRSENVLVVRHGKGDKHGIVVMDDPWGWRELDRWLVIRERLSAGYVFPVLRGPNAGGRWADCDVRRQLHQLQVNAGVRKRIAPHQFRHGHAVELWREGLDVYTIQKQLRHANLNVTARYLSGVDPLKVAADDRAAPAAEDGDRLMASESTPMGRSAISAAGRCEWCGCTFRKSSDVLRHRCAAMQKDIAEAEAEARNRQERWLNDPVYHAHVEVARRWIEMSQGAAPDELLSYAMDLIEDIGHLPPVEREE